MYKIQEESTLQAMDECLALGKDYYNEVESKHNHKPWKPNPHMVKTVLDLGLLHIITCRLGKELIGYTAFMVTEDFMTSESSAKELALYILPEYRGGRVFLKLMQKWEELCIMLGVGTLVLGFKLGHNDGLPERLGYQPTETIYQKFIG